DGASCAPSRPPSVAIFATRLRIPAPSAPQRLHRGNPTGWCGSACNRTAAVGHHRRRARYPMAAVETIDSVIQVALAVVLILLILMHSGKDSGLSGAFGVGSGVGPLGGGSLV